MDINDRRPLLLTEKMIYEPSSEYNLSRAVENIKLAQQVHKRELDKKDEMIMTLQKQLEEMQFQGRENIEYKRLKDKENRELLSTNQFIRHELSMERRENERLREEVARLRQDSVANEDKIAYLEAEQDKANHIIRNLLKKSQTATNGKGQQQMPSIISSSSATTLNSQHHHQQQHTHPAAHTYHHQQPLLQPRV